MKSLTKFTMSGTVALLALAYSSATFAAPVSLTCVSGEDRTVTLDFEGDDASVSCGPTGSTPPSEGQYWTGLGYTQLEKFDDIGNPSESGTYITAISGLGGTSGAISLIDGLVDAVLVFKFGSGGVSPDWISFFVSGNLSADWSVNLSQALSHVTLYGERPPFDVPEPASLALLGIGLIGIGYRARRRQRA